MDWGSIKEVKSVRYAQKSNSLDLFCPIFVPSVQAGSISAEMVDWINNLHI